MVRSLLYVSHSKVAFPDTLGQINNIVDVARSRNARLDVTGALIATHAAFAQLLEGSSAAIDELMHSIRNDVRHEHVRVVQDHTREARRFARWTMAYSGRSTYAQLLITPLQAPVDKPDPALCERLIRFMHEFSEH